MNNNYLKHYGVKGMKWGVRRNKSTLTADDYKRIKSTVDKTSSAVESGSRVNERIIKNNSKRQMKKNQLEIRKELETMSDKELQQRVNRLNMEERYATVMNSRYTNEGRNTASRILENTGVALAIGSSALSIMIAMKELQK